MLINYGSNIVPDQSLLSHAHHGKAYLDLWYARLFNGSTFLFSMHIFWSLFFDLQEKYAGSNLLLPRLDENLAAVNVPLNIEEQFVSAPLPRAAGLPLVDDWDCLRVRPSIFETFILSSLVTLYLPSDSLTFQRCTHSPQLGRLFDQALSQVLCILNAVWALFGKEQNQAMGWKRERQLIEYSLTYFRR